MHSTTSGVRVRKIHNRFQSQYRRKYSPSNHAREPESAISGVDRYNEDKAQGDPASLLNLALRISLRPPSQQGD